MSTVIHSGIGQHHKHHHALTMSCIDCCRSAGRLGLLSALLTALFSYPGKCLVCCFELCDILSCPTRLLYNNIDFSSFTLLLSVPLLYHSMGQIIKSVFFVCVCVYVCMYVSMYVCMYVCMCVSVGTLTVAFFNRSSRNLVRTFGI